MLKVIHLNDKRILPMLDGKGVIEAVGNKFKAVFGKGKENNGRETEGSGS